jgi:putative ABC transport system permease protein
MIAGFVTGVFHISFGISPILAGILTQIGLWSVNLAIMGRANQAINVNNYRLLVSLRYLQEAIKGDKPFYWSPIIVVGLINIVIIAALYWFFGTEMGCGIRATGNNLNMARAQGINTDFNKMLGLMLSNGLVAFSGGILAQYQSFADINMGRGAIVIGLAAVIIGEVIFGKIFKNFALRLLGVVLGAVVYYVVIQTVLWLKLDPNYLKLLTAVVVAVFLAVPHWKEKIANKRQIRKGDAPNA